MWEYNNGKCRHRSVDVNADTIKDMVEKEIGSYVGLKTHLLGKNVTWNILWLSGI